MTFLLDSIIYRRLSENDFDKINSRVSSEYGGGGQGYIDFPVAEVSISEWTSFLGSPTGQETQGPSWHFNVHSSCVLNDTIPVVKIYQRRRASVCVAAQRLYSSRSNRIPAWNPDNGFPVGYRQGIIVYFAKTISGEIWAGWLQLEESICQALIGSPIEKMLDENFSASRIVFKSRVSYDSEAPFGFDFSDYVNYTIEEDVDETILGEDISKSFLSEIAVAQPKEKERYVRYKTRNRTVVKELKSLYNGICQISGETFTMKNGKNYSEVHHLIPIGSNGSDSFANAIVVSPRIHRMLHYADVEPIELDKIEDNKLPIIINGQTYVITYKPEHQIKVKEALSL